MTEHRPFVHAPQLRRTALPDAERALLLDPETLDAAIIGMHQEAGGSVFVYDAALLIDLLATSFEDDPDVDADEEDPESSPEGRAWLHLQEDILRWHAEQGPRAPLILQCCDDEHPAQDDDERIDYQERSWTILARPSAR